MSQGWVFTLNNPQKEIKRRKWMKYLVYVLQKAPTTGTPHYQGYMQTDEKTSRKTVQSGIPNSWVERQRGSATQARNYIILDEKKTNSGEVKEEGEFDEKVEPNIAQQGKRTELHSVMQMLKEGKEIWEITLEYPNAVARYEKWINETKRKMEQKELKEVQFPIQLPWCSIEGPTMEEDGKRQKKKRHIWIVGEPDIGKSFETQSVLDGYNYWLATKTKYTFETYEDQSLLVFDDCWPTLQELLDCSNIWIGEKQRTGDQRYVPRYWKKKQVRTMIVLSNKEPTYKQDSFWARFTVYKVEKDCVKEIGENGLVINVKKYK